MSIPVFRPSLSEEEKERVLAVLESRWWGNGPVCEQFEAELGQRYGAECITVNSATAALHLALVARGIGPGDEVLVPDITFVSTALAVAYTGAKPVLCDVRKDTLTLDWDDAKRRKTWRTAAAIPVDYAGYPADRPTWAHDLYVVQDAAHSTGGKFYGDVACLSFHPVKILATGDGGAILFHDFRLRDRFKALRWCGIDRSTWARSQQAYTWDYTIDEIGYKYHWNDLQAAIGLAQLHRLPELLSRRWTLAGRYAEGFAGHIGIERPPAHPEHTWHLYTIRVDPEKRAGLIESLAQRDIAVTAHYKPLHLYPPFRMVANIPQAATAEAQRVVCLPMYPDLSEIDQDRVIQEVTTLL